MEMSDQTMNSDHMYGVKGSMQKAKSAPMTVVTSEGDVPGSKNIVVVPATGSGDPPAKRHKASRADAK